MLDWEEIQVINRLVEGLTEDNTLSRLRALLARLDESDVHIQALVSGPHPLPEDPSEIPDRGEALLAATVAAVRFVARTDVPSHEIERVLSPADSLLRERLWIVFGLERGDRELLTHTIRRGFGTRLPTAEDVRVLDWLAPEVAADMADAVPPPPDAAEVRELVERNRVPAELINQWCWLELSPRERADWAEVSKVLAERFGSVTRERFLNPPPRVEAFVVGSPIEVADLQGRDPMEVAQTVSAWRKSPGDYTVDSRELARTLQQVVEADAQAWNTAPVEYASELREPIYIAHFLRGMAQAVASLESPRADALIEVIRLVDSEPWEPTALGSPDWDYDPDWRSCRDAAIDLLESLAKVDELIGGGLRPTLCPESERKCPQSEPSLAPPVSCRFRFASSLRVRASAIA